MRLLSRCNYGSVRLGPRQVIEGYKVVACRLKICTSARDMSV